MSSFKHKSQAGYLMVLVIVLGSVLFMIAAGLIGFIITEHRVVEQRYQLEQASDIAEAGLNYYKWYLAHYPGDVTNGTGAPGPYVHPYRGELGTIGEFSLTISSSTYCNQISSIYVESTGYTYAEPSLRRTISARYAQPTVAEYAYIINSNVWAGADREIYGPYHSNQGIRMDGTNYSTVTSGQASWNCTSSFGCSPSSIENGVFTSTANANELLFAFPSAPINFTDLSIDLAAMADSAQNDGGIYIPYSNSYGYRLIFNADGTLSVRRVTNTYQYWAESTEDGRFRERNIIANDEHYATYSIDEQCPLIYVNDKVWLEGEVTEKVTVAVAGTDIEGEDPDIVLEGNITYETPSEDGLLAIAEDDVLIGVTVPDDMELNGIFVAQNGRFGRNYYGYWDLPYSWWYGIDYRPYYQRDSLSINGTIVSNGRVGTKWTSGGAFVSGFENRTSTYDRYLVDNPPPLVPNTSDVYEFVEWREEQ